MDRPWQWFMAGKVQNRCFRDEIVSKRLEAMVRLHSPTKTAFTYFSIRVITSLVLVSITIHCQMFLLWTTNGWNISDVTHTFIDIQSFLCLHKMIECQYLLVCTSYTSWNTHVTISKLICIKVTMVQQHKFDDTHRAVTD